VASGHVQRRLAAILAADVVAYSRLIEADEEGTRARLRSLFEGQIFPLIGAGNGRIFKTTGDGFLVEFPSVVAAVRTALDVQEAMRRLAENASHGAPIELRIGLNVGDVIVEGDDIHGDGVNVAARLEGLCEPSEVFVSGAVFDQAEGKVAASFDDLGTHALKNIAKPARVYRARIGPRDADGGTTGARPAAPPLSDKPSIAVLPFDNLSGDSEQDYFSDGITEDLITELSRYRELLIIARDSSFQYKGRSQNVKAVAADLAVRYVLQGSVRRAGARVRITAQLVAAETARHIWAERYDRELSDIFAVQDEVVRSIVASLPAHVEAADLERAKRKTPANLAAYDYLLRAKEHHHRISAGDNARAIELLDQAIALEPEYAHAHAWLACVYGQAFTLGFLPPADPHLARCVREAETAFAFDPDDSEAHRILAEVRLQGRRYDEAWHHHERALALNPNDARIVAQHGEFLSWLGRPEDGIEWIAKAIRLDPSGAERRAVHLGRAYFLAGRPNEALAAFARCGHQTYVAYALRAACHAALGQEEQARAAAAEVLRLRPGFAVNVFLATQPYREHMARKRSAELMVAAGLPR
jgi:adenylate cyclase